MSHLTVDTASDPFTTKTHVAFQKISNKFIS